MPSVTVVGGGVAGLSAACALAEAGWRVLLLERRSYLGGRAASFRHPGVHEVIDNCQHVLFGCCTNLLGYYRRIGVAGRIHWTSDLTLLEPGGRATVLGPSALPPPLHGLPRFAAAHAFSWADKLAIARAFRALLRPCRDDGETLAAWLRRHGQTPGAIERFWKLVLASALNADLEAIAVPYAAKVIRELFLNSADAGRMGMSTVPLGELSALAAEFIAARGGEVQCNTRVEGLEGFSTDATVLALPFEALAKLAPEEFGAATERFEHWPICSVHLWYDREITGLEHAVLLDRPFHWMYNKTRLQPGFRKGGGTYLELVVSAAREIAAQPAEQTIAAAAATLGEFFPAARGVAPVKAAVIKEVHATFGVPPGIDAARPGPKSPWPGIYLAGDWTRTGWPSTMESAARSGHLAAEAVLQAAGSPRPFLVPDLPPRGLMKLFA